MRGGDILQFSLFSLSAARVRSGLMLLAMSIGVAAVIVLTGVGDGARLFITGECCWVVHAAGQDCMLDAKGATHQRE